MGETNFDTINTKALKLDGTAVSALGLEGLTASAAELNVLDGALAGVAVASKGVVLDTALQVAGICRPVVAHTDLTTNQITAALSGAVILVTAADQTLTLPATVEGLEYTIILAAAGLSTGAGLAISPAAADQIIGNGFTPADNKDAILAGSGDRAGDTITLVGDGVAGWYITAVTGTWTREA